MTQRTTRSTVRFRHGFALRPIAGRLPPGVYTVETTEERIEETSFDAYRRMATTLFLPAGSVDADVEHFATIDPAELASALQRDGGGENDVASSPTLELTPPSLGAAVQKP